MKKIIILIATVVFSLLTLTGCMQGPIAPIENSGDVASNENLVTYEMPKTMAISAATYNAAVVQGKDYLAFNIKATVLPSTATNKTVDWSVHWLEDNDDALSDYVAIIPESDGSTTAEVRILKGGFSDFSIIVETREGGYTATCLVQWVGTPTDITLSSEDENLILTDTDITIGINRTYLLNVDVSNIFDNVGADFNNFEVLIKGVGTLTMGDLKGSRWESVKTVNLEDIGDRFATVAINNGVIMLESSDKTIEGYYSSSTSNGVSFIYYDKVKEISDDCQLQLEIRELNSGLSKTYNINFDNTIVSGVNLDNSVVNV